MLYFEKKCIAFGTKTQISCMKMFFTSFDTSNKFLQKQTNKQKVMDQLKTEALTKMMLFY